MDAIRILQTLLSTVQYIIHKPGIKSTNSASIFCWHFIIKTPIISYTTNHIARHCVNLFPGLNGIAHTPVANNKNVHIKCNRGQYKHRTGIELLCNATSVPRFLQTNINFSAFWPKMYTYTDLYSHANITFKHKQRKSRNIKQTNAKKKRNYNNRQPRYTCMQTILTNKKSEQTL